MKNENATSKKRIIFTIIEILLTTAILVAAILSFAWFAKNKTVTAESMTTKMFADEGINVETFQVYKRDGATGGAAKVADQDTLQNIYLTEFDTVFTDKNVNTPIIVRAVLSDIAYGNNPIKCSVSLPAINWTSNNASNGTLLTFFSNVAELRCNAVTTLDAFDINAQADNIYNGAVEALAATTQKSFTKVDSAKSNVSKSDTIDFVIDEYTPTSDGSVIVYIEINYNMPLVEAYIYQHDIDPSAATAGMSDIIDFPYDLGQFSFKYSS